MTDGIRIRQEARVGRITLDRPHALNALTCDMVRAVDAALADWSADPSISLIVIDATGDKAICAGGDVSELYERGIAGDHTFGRTFWRDEYRMNARIAGFSKPVVSLMQGYTLGGGVGVGCHASHRVVGDTSRIGLPECGIGMVPDVGGSGLLARAPGRLGEYLGLTAARLGPGDAIHAGFADCYLPEAAWPDLVADLVASGDVAGLRAVARSAPAGTLVPMAAEIDTLFDGRTAGEILKRLTAHDSPFAETARASMARNSPLAMACAVEMLHRLRRKPATIQDALALEYRFAYRAFSDSDFLEGVRAAIIDKDRMPRWRHADTTEVPDTDVSRLLAPLPGAELTLEEDIG